eukprot:2353525-Rhodomonas_salina.1
MSPHTCKVASVVLPGVPTRVVFFLCGRQQYPGRKASYRASNVGRRTTVSDRNKEQIGKDSDWR